MQNFKSVRPGILLLVFLFACSLCSAARVHEKSAVAAEPKTDTLANWKFSMDRQYQSPFHDSVKPLARIVFWRSKPLSNGADSKEQKNTWTPDISFELFSVADADWCYKASKHTIQVSNCRTPGTGGDVYVVGNYVFLNRQLCVNCVDHATQTDYCRPVMSCLFRKMDKNKCHSLDDLAAQLNALLPDAVPAHKTHASSLLPLKTGNYWVYSSSGHPGRHDTVRVTGIELSGTDTVYLYDGKRMTERADTVCQIFIQRGGHSTRSVEYVATTRPATYGILIGGDVAGRRTVTKLEGIYKSNGKTYRNCYKYQDGMDTTILSRGIGVIEQIKTGGPGTISEKRYLVGYKIQ